MEKEVIMDKQDTLVQQIFDNLLLDMKVISLVSLVCGKHI